MTARPRALAQQTDEHAYVRRADVRRRALIEVVARARSDAGAATGGALAVTTHRGEELGDVRRTHVGSLRRELPIALVPVAIAVVIPLAACEGHPRFRIWNSRIEDQRAVIAFVADAVPVRVIKSTQSRGTVR